MHAYVQFVNNPYKNSEHLPASKGCLQAKKDT